MTVLYTKAGVPQPKMLNLVCDRISMTLDIPISQQKVLMSEIEDIPHYAGKGNYNCSRAIPLNKKYLPFGADKTGQSNLLLQCSPNNKYKENNMRFFRAEWNPSQVDGAEVEATINNLIPNLFGTLLIEGMVTRIDLAVDVAQVECDDLLFHYPKSTITDVRSKTGRTEYIGGSKSPTSWCIYDKIAEIEAKNKKKAMALKKDIPKFQLTRFELRLKPVQRHILDLVNLNNPFAKLIVSAYTNFSSNKDVEWNLFLDSCRLRGAQAALFKIKGSSYFEEFKSRLDAGLVDWWKPGVIWSQLPEVIENIVSPDFNISSLSAA